MITVIASTTAVADVAQAKSTRGPPATKKQDATSPTNGVMKAGGIVFVKSAFSS